MKFLIAFALFAVAFGDVVPFSLREAPAPAIEGFIDHPYMVKVVESPTPITAQETSAAVSSIADTVKVVDFVKSEPTKRNPIGEKATFEEADLSYDGTVKFVDEAVNVEHVDISPLVKDVESLLEAAPSGLAVTVVEEAVNDIDINEDPLDKVVETPLEGALSGTAVNFVDESDNLIDEESPLVKAEPVNFVDEAVNNVVSDTEIAPSFDSFAGISQLIKAAQEQKNVEATSTDDVVSPDVLIVPTPVKVVEIALNTGHIEDSVDVHAKADGTKPINIAKIAQLLRGKVFNNPMLR